MAIHWNIENCENLPRVENKKGSAVPELTDTLIYATVIVGVNPITEKNYMTMYRRMTALEVISGRGLISGPKYSAGRGPSGDGVGIRPDQIKMHIGLSTNASPLSDAAFRKKLVDIILDDVKNRELLDQAAAEEIADEESDFVAAVLLDKENLGLYLKGGAFETKKGWFKKTKKGEGKTRYSSRSFGCLPLGESVEVIDPAQVLKEIPILPTMSGHLPYIELDLEPGDRVRVFEDPMTCEKLEGEAELVEFVEPDAYFEIWKVRFDGEAGEPVVERKINLGRC